MGTVLRTTARLDDDEAAFVARMKMAHTDEAAAVRELTGLQDLSHAPVATLVHIMIEAGIQAIKAKAEEIGQARLVEFLKTDPEHQAWRDSRRKRARVRSAEALA